MWRSSDSVPRFLRRLGLGDDRARMTALCTEVGDGLRVVGSPEVDNAGTLEVGANVSVTSRPAPTRLRTGPEGRLVVGNGSTIGFGCVLSADASVVLGERVELGPYVFAVDGNVGDPDLGVEGSPARPIVIGDDAKVQGRATILKGSRIGCGATIQAGSVVASAIPPGALAAGNPAVVVRFEEAVRIHDPLFAQAWLHPDRPAIVAETRSVSYAELWSRVRGLAFAIGAECDGSAGPPRVLFVASEKTNFVASLFACSLAEAVAIPVPESAAPDSLREIAGASGARLLVGERRTLERFENVAKELGLVTLHCDEVAPLEEPFPRRGERERLASSAPALVMFTSGTTAKRKAVLLGHANLLQATANMNAFMRLDGSVREFVSVPLHHSFGLGRVRAVLSVGGTLVVDDGPLDPARMVQLVEQRRANTISAVPAGFALFRGRFAALLRRIGPQIRLIELGSAFMTPEQKLDLTVLFPNARVCMHYGLTEASRSTFLEFREEAAKLHTVGRPSPNVKIRVVDAESRACEPNVEGEIVVYGEHVTRGYLGDEELSARSFTSDGGFRTGDYGSLDEDGYLRLVGRKDEIINKGGIKIAPLELEAKLKELYPEVDLCVLGIPDPAGIAGEIPVVAYTPPAELELKGVLERLSKTVDSTKLPDAVFRVSSIPRTENGKPQRRILRDELARGAESAPGRGDAP